jgi:pyruvate decarboxylase
MDAEYNDIQPWRHTKLLEAFGASPDESASYQVRTKKELDALFNDEKFASAPHIQLVEIYMDKKDAPRAMVAGGEIGGKKD